MQVKGSRRLTKREGKLQNNLEKKNINSSRSFKDRFEQNTDVSTVENTDLNSYPAMVIQYSGV